MRFPLSLTTDMAGYMLKQKVMRRKKFPLVLMLEPLHACNLTCTGCGKKVLTPVYFDTRGRFYCDPCCWEVEEIEPTRRRNIGH